MSAEGLVFERGARFIAGAPHPTASVSAFSANALRNTQVKRVLQGSRWRLLGVQNFDEMDADGDRNVTRESEAIYYDYTRNRTVRVRGAGGGRGKLDIQITTEQPIPTPQEFAAAAELVRQSPVWGPMLAAGQVRFYKPMPPMREPDLGEAIERTLFVGLISKPRKFNRIVAVNMVTGAVSPEPIRPWRARATDQICGVQDNFCFSDPRGTEGRVTIEWPARHPVWRFQAIRPTASLGCNGSGIELRDVRYRGRNVLKQAHIPILNVQYDSDTCGPYRDWLYEETCFEANGTNIPGAPGFRWCDEPAKTIWDTNVDGGNFQGVAVYEDPNDGALVLVSVCSAGWYRYLPEWRFYPDGRIQPRFKFGAVSDTCTCDPHRHHAYWRFHFRILNRFNVLEEKIKDQWVMQRRETGFFRNESEERLWRVRNYRHKRGYEIIPGDRDGVGDNYSGDDQFVFLYNRFQIDDGNCNDITGSTEANLAQFLNNAPIINRELVVWYAAHFYHHQGEDGDPHSVAIGPTLQPFNWPTR